MIGTLVSTIDSSNGKGGRTHAFVRALVFDAQTGQLERSTAPIARSWI
jgi:hypothetical protein